VSPYNFHAVITNKEAIVQITSRKVDFPKPTKYKSVKIFGQSILTSDGEDFRRHKKVVGPVFSEKSNAFVFEESARQAEKMLNFWAGQRGNTRDQMKVTDTASKVSLLALHVICGAGFGVPQRWLGEDESVLGAKVVPGFNTEKLLNGHKMTFKNSLDKVTSNLLWLSVLPLSILGIEKLPPT
jgi:cytochrome P450